ncbi:MAG TPA: bifunctional nuclease domain-containing protein [Chloroflexota bacterium]
MEREWIEVELHGVHSSSGDVAHTVAVIGPRHASESRLLALDIGPGDAHFLWHERRGQETVRSQALCLADRIAAAMGGRVAAAHLVSVGPGLVTAAVVLETPSGRVEVPTEPGQAIAISVRLDVPLFVDAALLGPRPSAPEPIGGPLAAFLDTLDLSGLGDGS